MAKRVIGKVVRCDHGREAPLAEMERLDNEKHRFGEEQGEPGRHGCTVCAWRRGYDVAVKEMMDNMKRALLGESPADVSESEREAMHAAHVRATRS